MEKEGLALGPNEYSAVCKAAQHPGKWGLDGEERGRQSHLGRRGLACSTLWLAGDGLRYAPAVTPGSEVVRTQVVGTVVAGTVVAGTDSVVAGTEVSEVVGIGTVERGVGTGTAAAKARCCTLAVGLIR